ncbi:MAG: 50S ribosomal protein L31e [archaeon]|nr:50S ribosomal protein L31e [archaeon]
MGNNTEKTVIIPLRATKMAPRTRRAIRAIKEVRDSVARHMGADSDKIWIDKTLNEKIWERGIQNPPKKISLKAVKFDDGLVEVSLAETKVK